MLSNKAATKKNETKPIETKTPLPVAQEKTIPSQKKDSKAEELTNKKPTDDKKDYFSYEPETTEKMYKYYLSDNTILFSNIKSLVLKPGVTVVGQKEI